MSATQFGLSLLYIAVAVICYAAGWWQGKTVERDRWEERAAAQDQLVTAGQQAQEPVMASWRNLKFSENLISGSRNETTKSRPPIGPLHANTLRPSQQTQHHVKKP